MSESGDSGPGRREVAHRLFAAEFDDADFSYSESDEERAPNYVVTPTGARVNRLFLVGVLTELEQVNDDVLRARVVDPTGPFVIYAGQYQPDELAFLEAADPPMFVAVTGKARTFQPDDSDRVFTSVRPESISEVDADTRDRWVVQAAEQTVSRIGQMASAKQAGLAGDELRLALLDQGIAESAAAGITLALDHYGTTGDYLDALRTTALDAARVVAGDTDEAEGLSLSSGDGTDDPIPLLASLDLDTGVSTPETTGEDTETGSPSETATDDAEATEPNEPTVESSDSEPTADEDVADAAEEGAPAAAADAEPAPDSPGAPAGDESPEPSADAATSDAPAETPETATDAGADETTAGESAGEDVPAEDVDLEDAVMEVMDELDDGSGADREELLTAVVDRYGADADAVDDAIQDALMGGRCYEPDDGKLTPI